MAKTTVLSLGAGVQSSVLLLMSCMGELPRLDAAIFADTRWETPAVYDHLEWLEMQAKTAGIPVYRVSAGSLPERVLAWQTGADDPRAEFLLPLHTATGMMRRQCTTAYKIEPIEACIRGLLGLKKGQRAPIGSVDLWRGISADELSRAHQSRNRWETAVYPLIGLPDMLPSPMRRRECSAWFASRFPGRTLPRSSCIGCPLRSNADWRELRDDAPSWANAVAFDAAIRDYRGLLGQAFLARAKVSLPVLDLDTPEERGQMLLLSGCDSGACWT